MTNQYWTPSHFPSASSFHVAVMNTSGSHYTSTIVSTPLPAYIPLTKSNAVLQVLGAVQSKRCVWVSIIVDLDVDVCLENAEVIKS